MSERLKADYLDSGYSDFDLASQQSPDELVELGQVEFARINRDRIVSQWTEATADVHHVFGQVGVERLVNLLRQKGRSITTLDCQEALADLPTRQELKQAMNTFLEKRGVMFIGENGERVVDLEELTNLKSSLVKEAGEFTYRNNKTKVREPKFMPYYNGQTRLLFYEALRDEMVVSSTDYAAGVRTPKRLLYAPDTQDQAFDQEAIRQADFYMGPWDLPGRAPVDENGLNYCPTDTGNVNWAAMRIACKLYNKNFGAAYRDDQGVLQIKYPNGEVAPPNIERFKKDFRLNDGLADTSGKRTEVLNNPLKFLHSEGAELVKSGLLTPDDLVIKFNNDVWDTFRLRRSNPFDNQGRISLGGVKYNLGLRFANQPYILYKISENLVGLARKNAEGEEKLEYTFPLVQDDEKEGGRDRTVIIIPTPYLPNQTSSGEAKDFADLLRLSNEFSYKAGVNLASLKFSEQMYLVSALDEVYQNDPDTILDFVKQHGTEGLRAFMALQADPQAAQAIFTIDKKYPPAQAALIFEKFSSLLDWAEKIQTDVAEVCAAAPHFRGKITQDALLGEFMKRSARVLSQYAEREKVATATALLRDLDLIQQDAVAFAAMFKTYVREHGPQSLTEIRGIDYQTISGLELARADKQEMISLSLRNYRVTEPDVPRDLEALLKDKERLRYNEFCILRQKLEHEDEATMLAFLRIEHLSPDRVYVGSFNVRAEAQQAGIAEQMISQTVVNLAKQYDVSAIMNQELAAGSLYIEQAGAVATGYVPYPPTERGPRGHFEILVEKDKQPARLAGVSSVELVKRYEKKHKGVDPLKQIGAPEILVVFDTTTERDLISQTADRLLNHEGYRMTRYLNLDGAGIRRLYGFEKN